jgi:hypothetical protein
MTAFFSSLKNFIYMHITAKIARVVPMLRACGMFSLTDWGEKQYNNSGHLKRQI